MSHTELSNEFDVLYNNITSNQAPGLNEYEKSVFLTKAQSQLVNEYFNNRTDGFGGGFDGSQKRQYDFSSLIKTAILTEIESDRNSSINKLDKRSKVFLLPDDYFLPINEIIDDHTTQYSVIPLNYVDYQRLMLKPYNLPVKKVAWRLITGTYTDTDEDNNEKQSTIVEIIGVFNVKSGVLEYKIRYVKTLSPIILADLGADTGVTIDGEHAITACQLPEEAHQEVLERAVALAKIAWQGATATQVQDAQQKNKE